MAPVYLIVDVGTGNLRVGAVDASSGTLLQIATCDTPYARDPAYADSSVFVPDQWKKVIRDLIGQVMSHLPGRPIAAISASSQREGIVLIDREDHDFLGIPNVDNRAVAYLGMIEHAKEIEERTGFGLNPAFCGPKLFATMQAQPSLAGQIHAFLSISDWIGYLFTGRIAFEHAQAMHTLVYDHVAHCWDQHLCDLFGIPFSWLPELVSSGSVLGRVTKAAAEDYQVPSDAVFITGGADTQLALIGMQADIGDTSIISGTTTPVEKLLDFPLRTKGGWLNPHARMGQYMLEVNAAYTGLNYQRFKQMFFPNASYEALEAAAEKRGVPPVTAMFSMGLCLPTPPILHAGFLLSNPIPFDLQGVDFFHAIALDMACGIAAACSYIDELTGASERLLCCGGGFQGSLLPKYIAALTGKPLMIYEGYKQASILGCARLISEALGRQAFALKLERTVLPEELEDVRAYQARWRSLRTAMQATNAISG